MIKVRIGSNVIDVQVIKAIGPNLLVKFERTVPQANASTRRPTSTIIVHPHQAIDRKKFMEAWGALGGHVPSMVWEDGKKFDPTQPNLCEKDDN